MTDQTNTQPTRPLVIWLARLLLMGLGLGCAGLMAFVALQLFPEWHPDATRFVFRESDGDAFRHQPGAVRPPAEDRVLEDFIRRQDGDGFRQARMTADHYPILALGDSFTEGGALPWVDVLAERLNTPVRNLGWRGFGPMEYVEVLNHFGADDHDWILIGYFEGNDLSNTRRTYEAYHANGTIDISRTNQGGTAEPFEILTLPDENYLYPLEHEAGGHHYELAYISDYLWWLNADLETFQTSRNMALLGAALGDVQAMRGSACVGLVYIPNKGHIHFRYSDPDGNRRYVLQNGQSLSLDYEGWLILSGLTPQDDATLIANLDHQREAVQTVTADAGVYFIDLTPAFMAAAEGGQVLYHTYDSHWNEAGHRLAGQTIAEAMQAVDGCP